MPAALLRCFAPSPPLAALVRCLTIARFEPGQLAHVAIRRLPDSTSHLHIALRGGTHGLTGALVQVSGPMERCWPLVEHIRDLVCAIDVELQPGAMPALFGLPTSAIAGHELPGDRHWPADELAALIERVATATQPAGQAAAVEAALLARLRASGRLPGGVATVQAALDLIGRHEGGIGMAALASGVGCSQRQLRRLFDQAVGVPPCRCAAETRFLAAFHHACGQTRPDWRAVAMAAGYCDQLHLCNDFTDCLGESPARFFQRHGDRLLIYRRSVLCLPET